MAPLHGCYTERALLHRHNPSSQPCKERTYPCYKHTRGSTFLLDAVASYIARTFRRTGCQSSSLSVCLWQEAFWRVRLRHRSFYFLPSICLVPPTAAATCFRTCWQHCLACACHGVHTGCRACTRTLESFFSHFLHTMTYKYVAPLD